MKLKKNDFLIPLIIIGILFFVIGFALGINSYLVPLLTQALNVSSGKSYLIIGATFSAFLIFSYPAVKVIQKIGYKKTMALSFLLFSLGFLLFIPSAKYASLLLFLAASFVSGIGNTFLQATVNPYITILGPIESAARRISIMGVCNKLAWPVAPVFLAAIIGKNIDQVTLTDINKPFFIIIAIFIILGVLTYFSPLQEIKAVGEDETEIDDCPYAMSKTSIWQFPHLLLGGVALFLYVGVETIALATIVDYAKSLGFSNPEKYAFYPSVGLVLGYICGIFLIPKYISQGTALKICSWLAVVASLLVVITPPTFSILSVSLIALSCSLMWPAIWPLAMTDLGRFTKVGSSILVSAIFGGAVIPVLFGLLKDVVGHQNAYWICLPCFVFILYYGIWGNKIRVPKKE